MLRIRRCLVGSKTRLIGPNGPGLIAPGKCKVGIVPNEICKEGSVGIVSRSGTLLFEAIYQLTSMGYGQSTCVGIGGDPVVGTSYMDVLKAFNDDPQTKAIVLIGEIGGNAEEVAAEFIRQHIQKPVIGYIAGRCTPEGKRMGHAGAMIAGNTGTALSKINALQTAGVEIAQNVMDVGSIVAKVLG
jgi:succinyl-CoA synthetase alpha subunit